MRGIELLGAVCALWGTISQESSPAASQRRLAGNFPTKAKPSGALKGLENL